MSSYELLRIVEEDGRLGIWSWDLALNSLTWSAGLYRILGVDPSETVSLDLFRSMIHPDDRLAFPEPSQIVTDGKLTRRAFRILRRDGCLRHVASRVEMIHSRDGDAVLMTGLVRDITEEEEARATLEATNRRLDLLARLLEVELWTAGPDGSAVDTAAWRRKTAQSSADVSGWGRLEAVHPEDRDTVRAAWREAVSGGERYQARYRLRRPDGTYARVHSRALPLRTSDGAVAWWFGACGADDLQGADRPPPATVPGHQLRAARAFLNWSLGDLATAAEVSLSTVRRAEADGSGAIGEAAWSAVARALSRRGVTFGADLGGALAVYLAAADPASPE
ncbi:PAS domain-containing protein [Chthonobacter rhizosphaerae]|uniref:PAS domain-containing protein n=1 Tax=Chthonobacter rhizosphaerae TaxID=2735553 RepID=UPI0015EF92AF|nr:PAS domain-containing protein [Chthonobacter rhizosphaerae]